jgi:hypothetical protein
VPARKPWYPQSAERAQSFCKAFPDAEEFGGRDGAMPWRFKAGLTPDQVLQAEAHLLAISRGPSCIISNMHETDRGFSAQHCSHSRARAHSWPTRVCELTNAGHAETD